jgi:hypothetical protein
VHAASFLKLPLRAKPMARLFSENRLSETHDTVHIHTLEPGSLILLHVMVVGCTGLLW